MFGLSFGSKKTIVGLDIGSNSVKAVELQRSRGEVMVSHLGHGASGQRHRGRFHDRG